MVNKNETDIILLFHNSSEHDVLDIHYINHDEIKFSPFSAADILDIYNFPTFASLNVSDNDSCKCAIGSESVLSIRELTLLSDVDINILKEMDYYSLKKLDYKSERFIKSVKE